MDFRERGFSGAGKDLAVRLETRTVTGAIPGFVRVIPAHDAFHMSADGGIQNQFAVLTAIGGDFVAIQFDDLPLADFDQKLNCRVEHFFIIKK